MTLIHGLVFYFRKIFRPIRSSSGLILTREVRKGETYRTGKNSLVENYQKTAIIVGKQIQLLKTENAEIEENIKKRGDFSSHLL